MKNAFYFIEIKCILSLFVLKIFICLSSFFGYVENSLISKLRLILKFMTSQTGPYVYFPISQEVKTIRK